MAEVKEEVNLQAILGLVDAINEGMKSLKQELGSLKGRVTTLEKGSKVEQVDTPKGDFTGVPADIKSVVENLLSDKVSVRIEDCKDRPAYFIHLTIPEGMSNSPVQPDIRSQCIRYADGVEGLKTWLQKVKINIAQGFAAAGEAPPKY